MLVINAFAESTGGNAGSNRQRTGYGRGIQAVGRRPAPRAGETQSEYMTRAGSVFGPVTSQNGQRLRSGRAVRNANTATAISNRRGIRGL